MVASPDVREAERERAGSEITTAWRPATVSYWPTATRFYKEHADKRRVHTDINC